MDTDSFYLFPVLGAVVILINCFCQLIRFLFLKHEQHFSVNPPNDLETSHHRHDWSNNPGVNDHPVALPPVLAPYRSPVQAVADAVAYDCQGKTKFVNDECVICLVGFEDGEVCQALVNCKHVYHRECIDEWMSRNSCCPICREGATVRDWHSNLSEPSVS